MFYILFLHMLHLYSITLLQNLLKPYLHEFIFKNTLGPDAIYAATQVDLWHKGSTSAIMEPKLEEALFSLVAIPR